MQTTEQLSAEANRLLRSGQIKGIPKSALDAACELATLGTSRECTTTPADSPEGRALAIAARQNTTEEQALRVLSGE